VLNWISDNAPGQSRKNGRPLGVIVRAKALEMIEEHIKQIAKYTALWIQQQHDKYLPNCVSLPNNVRAYLTPYFEPEILLEAKFVFVDIIKNPSFYNLLANLPISFNPIDFRLMDGITFNNVILLNRSKQNSPFLKSLIFHELVHFVQYKLLGITLFANQYISGFFENGLNYPRIPLELIAYRLQNQFETSKSPFSVSAEVRNFLGI